MASASLLPTWMLTTADEQPISLADTFAYICENMRAQMDQLQPVPRGGVHAGELPSSTSTISHIAASGREREERLLSLIVLGAHAVAHLEAASPLFFRTDLKPRGPPDR